MPRPPLSIYSEPYLGDILCQEVLAGVVGTLADR